MNKPTPEEMIYIASIKDKKQYSPNDRNVLFGVYNRIHGTNDRPTSCGSCVAKKHRALLKVYKDNLEN